MPQPLNDVPLNVMMQEKAKLLVQNSFEELISPDAWDAMVSKEIDTFILNQLKPLVTKACETHLAELIQVELSKPEWKGEQVVEGGIPALVAKNVREILINSAPDMLARILNQSSNMVLSQLYTNVTNLQSQINSVRSPY